MRYCSKRCLLGRAISLLLVVLVAFLSYRPTTAILSLAGFAQNPSDDGRLGSGSEIGVRENKPRPAKAQQRETRRRISEETGRSNAGVDREGIRLARIRLSPLQGLTPRASVSASAAECGLSSPRYLQLFLPAFPGIPHSPPA